MEKHRIALVLASVLILLSFLLAGCGTTGIPQTQYDSIVSQLSDAQAQVTGLLGDKADLEAARDAAAAALETAQGELATAQDELEAAQGELEAAQGELEAAQGELATTQDDLEAAQGELETAEAALAESQDELAGVQDDLDTALARVAALEGQVSGEEDDGGLVGETKAETAANIVSYYHETHVYSSYDLFVCGDMASEVWNMLKAQGIDSLIVVGNKDSAVGDILLSNHAWVLAEVAPGEYLALETTGGYTVTESQNSLYYQGWAFGNPGDFKSYNDLVNEHNVRVEIHNDMVAEANAVGEEYEDTADEETANQLYAVYEKLVELVLAQEDIISDLSAQINGLATELS
jgi:outer membrane murein-binding lipoprotein Lpp